MGVAELFRQLEARACDADSGSARSCTLSAATGVARVDAVARSWYRPSWSSGNAELFMADEEET